MKALEEELTRKEERWNATFTRLKQRAETKERECEEKDQQIGVLEQEKLKMWEKEVGFGVGSFNFATIFWHYLFLREIGGKSMWENRKRCVR